MASVSLGKGNLSTRGRIKAHKAGAKAHKAGARHVTVSGGRVSVKDFLALVKGSPVEMGR